MKLLYTKSFIVLLLPASQSAYAHLGSITGSITDGSTNLPLRGVTVQQIG